MTTGRTALGLLLLAPIVMGSSCQNDNFNNRGVIVAAPANAQKLSAARVLGAAPPE